MFWQKIIAALSHYFANQYYDSPEKRLKYCFDPAHFLN